MTNMEMLELAAKAAGIELQEWTGAYDVSMPNRFWSPTLKNYWNPLEDDGDALRLAVKLNIGVMSAQYTDRTCAWQYCKGRDGECLEPHGSDMLAATRRAIVRCAANIGKVMP
jgi:hypothetical protein